VRACGAKKDSQGEKERKTERDKGAAGGREIAFVPVCVCECVRVCMFVCLCVCL